MATYIKVGGTWRTVSGDTESVCGYTKVGGVWKAVSDTYVKVAGTWRSVCAPTPPPPPPPPGDGGPVDPPQDSSVSSLSPSSGEATGGYTVSILGSFPSNFTNISVNGVNVGSFTRVSSSQYNFTMPSGSAGTTVQVQAFNGRTPLLSSRTFTYNSTGGGVGQCINPNLCQTIVYSDGTVVTIGATNGTFTGSLQTEPCGNGGTRTQAYTCVTPAFCPNIPVGSGQCIGEVSSGCTVPYLIGLDNTAASNAIIGANLYYEGTSETTVGATPQNNGTVQSSNPPAGTSVNCFSNVDLVFYQYVDPGTSAFTFCPSLGYAVPSSGFPGNCPGACNCSPLTSTSGEIIVPTSTCASGRQSVTYVTYNACCGPSYVSPIIGACVAVTPTACEGTSCSEARCQTCDPNLSRTDTRSVSTSDCASGTMNTYICWTPGTCANIITDTGCVGVQNCTPVYSGTESRQCVQTCGGSSTPTQVAISVNPCTRAESWQCPACSDPAPPPTSNCTTCNGSYANSCGTYGNGTLCVTPSGCPNICYGGETPPPPPPPGCELVRIYYDNEYGDSCSALQNPCTGAITSVSCS